MYGGRAISPKLAVNNKCDVTKTTAAAATAATTTKTTGWVGSVCNLIPYSGCLTVVSDHTLCSRVCPLQQ